MPQVKDVNSVIQRAKSETEYRFIILVDQVEGGNPVWGKFVHRYDDNEFVGLASLFSSTVVQLRQSSDSDVFSVDSLPILRLIGRYRVSVVTRITPTQITISDGESLPTDSYIGLGS